MDIFQDAGLHHGAGLCAATKTNGAVLVGPDAAALGGQGTRSRGGKGRCRRRRCHGAGARYHAGSQRALENDALERRRQQVGHVVRDRIAQRHHAEFIDRVVVVAVDEPDHLGNLGHVGRRRLDKQGVGRVVVGETHLVLRQRFIGDARVPEGLEQAGRPRGRLVLQLKCLGLDVAGPIRVERLDGLIAVINTRLTRCNQNRLNRRQLQ